MQSRLLPAGLLALLGSHVASGGPDSTARLIPISESAWAGSSINVVANVRHTVFTHGRTQFAAYYDADGVMVLAKRQIGADRWETRRTAHKGNVADAHNAISLMVDGAGVLHVAWDHHGSPVNYARGISPGSLELGSKQAMTGAREARVTYPQFFRLRGGDLLFLYRDGASGQGTLALNRYAIASGAWTTVQANLIDGEGVRSPYWDMTVDRTGTLHLAWVWRDSPDVATNHDLCYVRSTDEGRTWIRSDGAPVTLPITAGTAEYAVRIPRNSNLMNSPAITADDSGRPYITTYWSPAPGAAPRFHVIHHDGTAWQTIAGPARANLFMLSGAGTRRPPISRAVVLVEPVGSARQIHLIYRDDARGASPRIVAATLELVSQPVEAGFPGPSRAEGSRPLVRLKADPTWTERELTSEPVGAWEPAIDPTAWARFRQVHMLVQQVTQRDGDDRVGATVPPTPIATLVWSPVAERLSAMPTTPASPFNPSALDRPLEASEVLAIMRRAADWQLANPPDPSRRPPTGWEVSPFYIGALALDRIAPDRRYRDAMVSRGAANRWQPHRRLYHADDYCVTQSYLELHRQLGDPSMLAPTKARLDEILARPPMTSMDWGEPNAQDRWTWCDALFMAPVAWLQMWKATGDARYLDYMNREWWATTTSLFLPATGFYFRDESFLDLREPNGKTIHWARGNGWVFAGLSRVLDLFPPDHPDYPRYCRLYLDMAASVLAAQQADGLWRPGLLDPVAHPARETSGSSFFTFGLAWGVNRGLLDRARVEPAVRRAWNALTDCVTAEGKLEHVQPIGAAPHGFDPHSTEPFAVGAFLLAGSEVHRLARE